MMFSVFMILGCSLCFLGFSCRVLVHFPGIVCSFVLILFEKHHREGGFYGEVLMVFPLPLGPSEYVCVCFPSWF